MQLNRKNLFALHGWLGMNFGLLLALVCLSGAFAVLSYEIEWLTQPQLRINPQGEIRWQQTYEALQQEYPHMHISAISKANIAVSESMAWSASLSSPYGHWEKARVDPYKAQVVRPGARLYLKDFMRQLHYNFMSNYGFYLVCFLGLPLLLSVVSGLLFYKRWWRHLFTLRIGKGSHAFFSSLHRLIGVWSLVFGIIFSLTGLWYLVELELVPYDVAYPPSPSISTQKMVEYGETPELLSLDEYIEAAKQEFPDLEPKGLSLPDAANDVVKVEGNAGSIFVRNRANAVFLNPYNANVVKVRRSENMDWLSWWVHAADSIHFGYWGGLFTKIIWALVGFCLPLLIFSGAYLSWQRAGIIGGRYRDSSRKDTISWWRRYPIRTWILFPLVIILAYSIVQGYYDRIPTSPPIQTILERKKVGPWQVSVKREQHVGSDKKMKYFVRFSAGQDDAVSFKNANLISKSPNGTNQKIELNGHPKVMTADVNMPHKVESTESLWLKIEHWSGKIKEVKIEEDLQSITSDKLKGNNSKTRSRIKSTGPVSPGAFYLVVIGYAVLSFGMVVGWLLVDRKK